jgi:hypothetical protein
VFGKQLNRHSGFSLSDHKTIVALFFLGIIVWFGFFRLDYLGGLPPGDTLTYSMLARNIVSGNGIAHDTAKTLEVATLGHFPEHDVLQPPFWPIILSLSFFIFGVSDLVIVLSSSFFYWLLIPLVYFLARKMFNERVALFSTVLTIFNFSLLKYSTSGLTEMFFTFLVTFSFFLIYRSEKRKDFVFIGFLLGIAYMTRSQAIFFVPGIVLFIFLFRKNNKYQNILIFLTVFFLSLMPFVIREHIHSEGTILSEGLIVLQSDDRNKVELYDQFRNLQFKGDEVNPLAYAMEHPLFVIDKFFYNGFESYKSIFPGLLSPFIIALFFANTLIVTKEKRTQEIKVLVILLLISTLVGSSLVASRARHLLSLLPIIIIFGTSFLISAYDRLDVKRTYKKIILATLILLLILPLPAYFLKTSAIKMQTERKTPGIDIFKYYFAKDMLQKHTKKGDVIITNNHSITGWYGDRKAILFPLRVADIDTIDQNYVSIGGIFLESGQMAMWSPSNEWWDILKNQPETVLEKFNLASSFNDGVTQAVLYIRK